MSDLDPTDVGDGAVAGGDPTEAAAAEAAEEVGLDREELLKRALVALADAEGVDVPDAAEVAAIESRLDDLDAEIDEKVADLRERFVDLYRELESKAPADHAHEETEAGLDAVAADLDAVAARLDELEAEATGTATVDEAVEETNDALDELAARVADLEALDDRVDDLGEVEEKLSRVASAVVRVRRRLEAAERDREDRERLDALTAAANREGVRKANCSNCGETVDIGLLTAPECPHCGRRFEEVEPNPGFLGTSRLIVGDRPALDGEVSESPSGAPNRGAGAESGDGDVSTRDADGGETP